MALGHQASCSIASMMRDSKPFHPRYDNHPDTPSERLGSAGRFLEIVLRFVHHLVHSRRSHFHFLNFALPLLVQQRLHPLSVSDSSLLSMKYTPRPASILQLAHL